MAEVYTGETQSTEGGGSKFAGVRANTGAAGEFLAIAGDTVVTEQGKRVASMRVNVAKTAGFGQVFGEQADAAATTDTGTFTFVSLFKRALQSLTTMISWLVALGNVADAAVITDSAGTISAKLRGLVGITGTLLTDSEEVKLNLGDVLDVAVEGDTAGSLIAKARGMNKVLGATNGAAVITDANGTHQQYLRGLIVLSLAQSAKFPTTLGTKAAASSLSTTLSTEDKAVIDAMSAALGRLAPTPVRRRGAVLGSTWSAAALWPGASGVVTHLKDIVFSTDAALNLKLHQATQITYATQIATDVALWHWQLDETSGSVASSIGSKTLTAVGAPTYSAACLVTADGTAIDLDGIDDGFTTSSPPASTSLGAIEAWVYIDTYPVGAANRYLALSTGVGTASSLGVGITTAGLPLLALRNSGGSLVFNANGPHPIPLKTWTHIVWSHDGTGLDLYVNGKLVPVTYIDGDSSTGSWYSSIAAAVTTMTIGYIDEATNVSWFDGRLSNVAWYAVAMSAAVAANHYKLGAPVWGPHYFAALGGTASPLGYEIVLESGASIYAGTSASGNATLELIGYEV